MSASTQTAWDAAYTTYQGWQALHDLDTELGDLAKASWDFGASRKDEDDRRTMCEADIAHLNRFGEPTFRAVAALVATPAPSIAAAREKMQLVTYWSIDDDLLPKPAVQLIADDIERLTGVRA